MSNFGNFNFMGSYITEQEILKLKNKMNNLIMKLFNTHNIEEETSINNEIKNQTEFLSSLLTIKRNELNLNNNMNNMNNMQIQQMQQQMMQQQMMQQQMMQQQMMQQQMIQAQQEAEMQKILDKPIITAFTVIFRASGATGQDSQPIEVHCMPDDKVSKIIERYRRQSGDKDLSKKFIFNAFPLNPDLTAAEAGLTDNANIFVVATKGVRGG